ncbi:dipeptide ABC transporter ATP-binding protein [Agromyces atrinae]|uniref:ABC transporter ATP-binding protein n=1 Tax=Agromyces atrinae TaxID=592376 RepID=A0A4Q2M958_9MICO|nr:ABC transporter ATP-binding protein [Agromyces atrinae]NYD66204.1 peptide/nickel transport system ATP-binding protein [Agromyces atrinae]RXZ86541.1 ABC transporter ATP-binding protein [Agromyces atrinae]
MTALSIRDLRIDIADTTLVDGVTFDVAPGEIVAVVGESGAGKSLTARALLGLTPPGARVNAAELRVDGVDMRQASETRWRRARGSTIALVSQDALVSLDPLRTIGAEVAEPLVIHRRSLSRTQRRERVVELLDDVALPLPERRARQYPHELSGGLRQRALIASAMAGDPRILVADEPTTALDSTVQVRILTLLRAIADRGVAVVFVSHDLGAVARIADRVLVMSAGTVVEHGTTADVLSHPRSDAARVLVAAIPQSARLERPAPSGAVAPVLEARDLEASFSTRRGTTVAVAGASFTLERGRTLGIVGESGSGKTTLARLLLGTLTPDRGTVLIDGDPWNPLPESSRRARRTRIQLVHQNPGAAFDPRWTVGRSLLEASRAGGGSTPSSARVTELLELVGLDPALARRRPRTLSGGQRQRASIARALAVRPEILVLDEPVSALDVSVQARILALLERLQNDLDLALVFISHDLGVVRRMADDVLVMQGGEVVEQGVAAEVFARPRHPFTTALLDAARVPPVG